MSAIKAVRPLGAPPWQTADPFLFAVHHDDAYPVGDERMAPTASLLGRAIGNDFEGKDGWRMYHGDVVPGFPHHPHRGFETVTIVRRGLIDHADSLGAAARFGAGDVQWLTAGKGIVHSEMFPLLDRERKNPLELFQIWLNLPRGKKMVDPYFSMLWKDVVPVRQVRDAAGRESEVVVVAGRYDETAPPSPPPDSWAADPSADVAIWTVKMAPGAILSLPPAHAGSNRTLYVFRGAGLHVDDRRVPVKSAVELDGAATVTLANGEGATDILVLQGRPIGEPVVAHGPFVMNSLAEIRQTFEDYQRTQFGGWKWPDAGPVHGRTEGRFARYPDGRIERPGRP